MSPEDDRKIREGHRAVMEEASRRGVLRSAEPLAPTTTATTVRVEDGKIAITDGPFAETKEQLAGYYILDGCEDPLGVRWQPRLCRGAAVPRQEWMSYAGRWSLSSDRNQAESSQA